MENYVLHHSKIQQRYIIHTLFYLISIEVFSFTSDKLFSSLRADCRVDTRVAEDCFSNYNQIHNTLYYLKQSEKLHYEILTNNLVNKHF